MQYITEYISNSYMTLMLLAGLVVILIANRRSKIEGTQYVWTIIGLVFTLTVFEYIEKWCIAYDKPVWIMYMKAAVCYSIHPLLILFELYLIAPIKHKLLMLIPYFVEVTVIIGDLFGLGNILSYDNDHHFMGGRLHIITVLVLSVYMTGLLIWSLKFIGQREISKAVIVFFVFVSGTMTTILEYLDIVTDHTTEIASLEIFVYYFYLAAIQYSQVQAELNEKRTQLMISQIQPHFIRNSLAVIRSLCYDDPEQAVDVIDEFSNYLNRAMKLSADIELVSLRKEMEFVDNYLFLEEYGSPIKLNVVKKLENTGFNVPPLSVQPIVENALKHAFSRKQSG